MVDLSERLSDRPLTAEENLSEFECGSEHWAVDVAGFLRENALTDQALGQNKTRLFYLDDDLAGFVSLLASNIDLREHSALPNRVGRWSTAPAVLLGQIGVHSKYQGKGIGTLLMSWTRYEVSQMSLGVRFIILHCDRENPALNWYIREGFIEADPKGTEGLILMAYDLISSSI